MKEAAKTKIHSGNDTNQHEEWFSSFIDSINNQIIGDKEELEKGDASKEKIAFYKSLISGDTKAFAIARDAATNILIEHIIINYLQQIKKRKISPLKLAFDLSINKIMVWVEIKENDEETEMALIRTESIINGEFFGKTKIYLDSTIVEDCDKLAVPSHY